MENYADYGTEAGRPGNRHVIDLLPRMQIVVSMEMCSGRTGEAANNELSAETGPMAETALIG
jgi:hypothetical protein